MWNIFTPHIFITVPLISTIIYYNYRILKLLINKKGNIYYAFFPSNFYVIKGGLCSFVHNASSLTQQSADRHVAPLDTYTWLKKWHPWKNVWLYLIYPI